MSKIVQTPTNIKNRTRKALQRGFSNVQIAIGILVTVILLLGALSGYQYIQQAKVNNEVGALTDIKAATVSLGQAGDFAVAADNLKSLIGMNFFENSAFTIAAENRETATNQWGGAVTAFFSATDAITVKSAGVPPSVCRDILPKIKTIVKDAKGGATPVIADGALDVANVGVACKPAAAGGTIQMTYVFSR